VLNDDGTTLTTLLSSSLDENDARFTTYELLTTDDRTYPENDPETISTTSLETTRSGQTTAHSSAQQDLSTAGTPTEDEDTQETDLPVSVRVEDGQRYVTTGTSTSLGAYTSKEEFQTTQEFYQFIQVGEPDTFITWGTTTGGRADPFVPYTRDESASTYTASGTKSSQLDQSAEITFAGEGGASSYNEVEQQTDSDFRFKQTYTSSSAYAHDYVQGNSRNSYAETGQSNDTSREMMIDDLHLDQSRSSTSEVETGSARGSTASWQSHTREYVGDSTTFINVGGSARDHSLTSHWKRIEQETTPPDEWANPNTPETETDTEELYTFDETHFTSQKVQLFEQISNCRHQSKNVAPVGEGDFREECSARMFTCCRLFRLWSFELRGSGNRQRGAGCTPTWSNGQRFDAKS